MTWIKTDYRFDDHRATFYATQKQMYIEKTVFGILAKIGDQDELEKAVLELICRYHPELAGCCVFYMGFNLDYGQWEFGVTHSSLPPVRLCEKCPRRPLDPAYELDLIASQF